MREWTAKNKDRINEARKVRLATDPEYAEKVRNRDRNRKDGKARRKNTHLKSAYGITLKEYTEMYKQVGGKCAICGNVFESLVVDHDHGTGEVRGLLCSPCNVGLGMFKDNPDYLVGAIVYLRNKGSLVPA